MSLSKPLFLKGVSSFLFCHIETDAQGQKTKKIANLALCHVRLGLFAVKRVPKPCPSASLFTLWQNPPSRLVPNKGLKPLVEKSVDKLEMTGLKYFCFF